MKKRIVCALLALVLLVGLVPVTALTAAAAGTSMSEKAITILKTWEKYSSKCDDDGFIGYGTKCPYSGKHGGTNAHFMYEKEADSELREVLADLDAAVNAFAGNYGLNLSQSQHDALVLFSFENGTAWTTGTGDFQTAIKNRSTGTEFLDAVCKWNYSTADDNRRMVEANMYLNGVYNSKAPSRFICVELDVGAGTMDEDDLQYYDVLSTSKIDIKPTPNNAKRTFLGWYTDKNERVIKLNKDHDGQTLTAKYQGKDGVAASYTIKKSALVSTTVYASPNGEVKTKYVNDKSEEVKIKLPSELGVVEDFLDSKGVHWAKVTDEDDCIIGWVKVSGAAASTGSDATMDVTVSVTNAYVNMRQKASIYSNKIGSRSMGDKLRITKTKSADGFLWGQVAASAADSTAVGWVALMYTDYETVKNASGNSSAPVVSGTVVAKATIIYKGYVNVRSEAGTDHTIVGSLAYGTTVDLYETTYVNGIKWGRCSSGWFCLNSYAKVETLINDTDTSAEGFANYAFTITLQGKKVYPDEVFRVSPYDTSDFVKPIWKDKAETKRFYLKDGDLKQVVSNLINRSGDTWAKSQYGWIKIFDDQGDLDTTYISKFHTAKFTVVADKLSVREKPENGAKLLDTLVRGTEVLVSKIITDKTGSTVWGIADKVGETVPTYIGWINLANKNVTRIDAPVVTTGNAGSSANITGTIATVVNTELVKVRKSASVTATQVGTLRSGSTYAVLDEKDGWYKLDVDTDDNAKTDSWVYGQYLDVRSGSNESNGTTDANGNVQTGMGIVANTYTGVNIRQGAGTGYAVVGKYLPGTTVEILSVETKGTELWGRTEKGWVSMAYIAMVSNYVPEGNGDNGGSNGSVTQSTVAIYTGEVKLDDTKVYKEPHATINDTYVADYEVRTLNAGDPVTVHELLAYVSYEDKYDSEDNDGGTITTKKTTYWARVNDGYILNPEDTISLYALDDAPYTAKKAVGEISGDQINLSANETVTVTKLKIVRNNLQGYVEYKEFEDSKIRRAWFDLADFTKGTAAATGNTGNNGNNGSNTNNTPNNGTATPPVIGSTGNTSTGGYVTNAAGYKYTGKVINTNELNVRATASTAAGVTTKLKSGAALVIYETVIAENMAWGRCDAGWVYLYYVDLTPAGNGAVDARVVYNENTIIYTDMNCSGVAGSYAKMSVIDIYEIVGNMARTELGWVNTDNLL